MSHVWRTLTLNDWLQCGKAEVYARGEAHARCSSPQRGPVLMLFLQLHSSQQGSRPDLWPAQQSNIIIIQPLVTRFDAFTHMHSERCNANLDLHVQRSKACTIGRQHLQLSRIPYRLQAVWKQPWAFHRLTHDCKFMRASILFFTTQVFSLLDRKAADTKFLLRTSRTFTITSDWEEFNM